MSYVTHDKRGNAYYIVTTEGTWGFDRLHVIDTRRVILRVLPSRFRLDYENLK
jgi:hypothetical protein